jgi:hypothetical protein
LQYTFNFEYYINEYGVFIIRLTSLPTAQFPVINVKNIHIANLSDALVINGFFYYPWVPKFSYYFNNKSLADLNNNYFQVEQDPQNLDKAFHKAFNSTGKVNFQKIKLYYFQYSNDNDK